MRLAIGTLRAAKAAVERGDEEPDHLPIWGMGDDEPPRLIIDAMWKWGGRGPHDPNPMQQATRADIEALHARWPATAPTSSPSLPSAPAPSAPSRPIAPGGRPPVGYVRKAR
jgi:hypothetical protein